MFGHLAIGIVQVMKRMGSMYRSSVFDVIWCHVIRRQQNSPGSRWSSGCFHTPGILSTGMPGWHPSEAQVLDGFDGCCWWSWLPGSWDEVEMDFEGLINQHGYKDYKDTMATCQFLYLSSGSLDERDEFWCNNMHFHMYGNCILPTQS